MVSLARSVSGLLYRSDGSLTGWTGDAEWTSAADPQMVCYPTGNSLLGPGQTFDKDGCREGQMLQLSSIAWWLLYDGGNGITGHRQFLAFSNDRGDNWQRLGEVSIGLNKVVSGTWPAVATGWLENRSGTYYLNRVVATGTFSAPNIGLPGGPYWWDVWTASELPGPWTASPNVPAGNQRMDGGGDFSAQHLPGSTVLNSGTYYNMATGSDGVAISSIGLATAANPDGPWTAPGSLIANNTTVGLGSRWVENGRVFYSATLARWVCLVNVIKVDLSGTDASGIGYAATLAGLAAGTWRRTQRLCPMDIADVDTAVLGIQSHVTGPDATLIEGPGGEVPTVYDADPKRYASAGNHLGRSLRTAVYEPSTHALAIAQSANTNNYRIKRTLSHTAAVIEFAACATARNGGGFELRVQYRSDSGGTNCYACVFTEDGLSLEKVVSGTPTELEANGGDLLQEDDFIHRIKIAVSGNTHRLYLDGELQVEYTDGSSPITSGTTLGISCQGAALQVRNLSVRTSDTITITGLRPSETVWLRGYGELPICAGSTSITRDHWPHFCLTYQGTDYTVSNALWGGDTLDFSGISTEPLAHACNRVARG